MSRLRKSALPVALGGALALALAILFRDYPVKGAVPAIFILALVLIAYLFGRLASLLSAALGGVVFALYLFEPYGTLAVESVADRMTLLGFASVALLLACVAPPARLNLPSTSGEATLVSTRIARNQHWIAVSIALLAFMIGLAALFRPR